MKKLLLFLVSLTALLILACTDQSLPEETTRNVQIEYDTAASLENKAQYGDIRDLIIPSRMLPEDFRLFLEARGLSDRDWTDPSVWSDEQVADFEAANFSFVDSLDPHALTQDLQNLLAYLNSDEAAADEAEASSSGQNLVIHSGMFSVYLGKTLTSEEIEGQEEDN